MAAGEEAVTICRKLADANPAAHDSDLAKVLYTVARIRIMSSAGLPEAFAAIRASVALYRQLAAGIPAAFAGDFTHSLALAADVLDDLGEREQAASLRLLLEAGALDEAARSLFARTPRDRASRPGTPAAH